MRDRLVIPAGWLATWLAAVAMAVALTMPVAASDASPFKASEVAVSTPQPVPDERAAAVLRPLSRDDIVKLFRPFSMIYDRVRTDYVEKPNDKALLAAAVAGMIKALPDASKLTSLTPPQSVAPATLEGFYAEARRILAARKADSDIKKVEEAAINGMLASLDPHSSYMDPGGFRDMQVQTRGEFGGVGLEVTMEDGLIKVVAPIDDAPAGRAGILANDLVTEIDGQAVQGLTITQAVEKMRGPIGSTVRLRIQRKGLESPLNVAIARELIRVRPVRSRIEGGDVGYVRITQFNEQTTEALIQAIADITAEAGSKLRGYVVDLRNNPGGLLDQAIAVTDAFLGRGEIVSTRGRNAEETQHFDARSGDLTRGKPIVVLINGGSASASEIVAGALQDHKRAFVLGSRSFGKGSVQTIIPLGSGLGALRLTTARYYTPSGRSIQAKGIVPDVEVLQDEPDDVKGKAALKGEAALPGHLKATGDEQDGSQAYVPPDASKDKALQAALERLRTTPVRSGRR